MKLLDLLLPTVLVKPGVNMWVFKASSELGCTVFFRNRSIRNNIGI